MRELVNRVAAPSDRVNERCSRYRAARLSIESETRAFCCYAICAPTVLRFVFAFGAALAVALSLSLFLSHPRVRIFPND